MLVTETHISKEHTPGPWRGHNLVGRDRNANRRIVPGLMYQGWHHRRDDIFAGSQRVNRSSPGGEGSERPTSRGNSVNVSSEVDSILSWSHRTSDQTSSTPQFNEPLNKDKYTIFVYTMRKIKVSSLLFCLTNKHASEDLSLFFFFW